MVSFNLHSFARLQGADSATTSTRSRNCTSCQVNVNFNVNLHCFRLSKVSYYFNCQWSIVFYFLRLRRYVLRLRFSYGYGYDLVITAPSLRLRHHRYGYDIIVTATTSSLLLRPLEAYIYDFFDFYDINLFLDHLAIKIDVLKLKLKFKLKLKLQAPWLPQVHSCSE